MAEEKADKKTATKTEKSTDGSADKPDKKDKQDKPDKQSGEKKSKTVNPEGQKRVTKRYLDGWGHIWRKKR